MTSTRINHLSFPQVLVNIIDKGCTQLQVLLVVVNVKDIVTFHSNRTVRLQVKCCNNKQRTKEV
jgi:hypothetical protein